MKTICSNCRSLQNKKLNEVQSSQLAPMSDGNLASDFHSAHFLCEECACVFTEYYPADRLQRYFATEYDVSDVVQNCQVVINDQKFEKHSIIHENLLKECANVAAAGTMLEIACGEGDLSRKFARQHKGWECTGIDPSAKANLQSNEKNLNFIRDFFHPQAVQNRKFDVIIAHGILNRVPTLKMLDEITESAKEGAIVSMEIVTLENSFYAPFIWDHSYTYLEKVFENYLAQMGLQVYRKYDCGSTVQFLAKFDSSKKTKKFVQDTDVIHQTESLYQKHIQQWEEIQSRFESFSKKHTGKIAVFGAGLYTAVLYHLVDHARIDSVVDEFRAGGSFAGRSVIGLDELKKNPDSTIFLCCRERNQQYLKTKLEAQGIPVVF